MADLTETIEEAAESPAAHAVDGESATARPIQDLIAADKYLAAKQNRTKGMNAILRQQMKAPSATGE